MIRRRMTVKRVDPWSVLKLGLAINIAGAAILVVTGVVVWSVVRRLQLVERICEPATNLLGLESCTVDGVELMRTGLLLAGLLVVVATGVMVFSAFLYNLIADLTGGIEVSMLDHSGQTRTSSGGVEVSPELTTGAMAPARTGGTGRTGRPAETPVHTGSTGPLLAPVGDQTIVSAAARPNTAVPLLVKDGDQPPVVTSTPEDERPGMLERAAAAGAVVKGAADRTGAVLTEAGRRATTALTEATEREAAARAQRTEAASQSLDDLEAAPTPRARGPARTTDVATSGSDSRRGVATREVEVESAWPGRDPDDEARRSREDAAARDRRRRSGSGGSGSVGAGSDGSGPDSLGSDGSGAPSPQEAAAARVRAQSSSDPTPPRDADGRFVSPDASPDDLFGSHPQRSEASRGDERGPR